MHQNEEIFVIDGIKLLFFLSDTVGSDQMQ